MVRFSKQDKDFYGGNQMAKSLIAAIIGLTVAFVINKLLEQRK